MSTSKSDVLTVVDGASSNGDFDFTIPAKTDTATINVFFAAGSPTATVELQEENEAAADGGESDPYAPVSGASYTSTTSDSLTGLTRGDYRISITGGPSGAIYVTVSR